MYLPIGHKKPVKPIGNTGFTGSIKALGCNL